MNALGGFRESQVATILSIAAFVTLLGVCHGSVAAEVNRWNGFVSEAISQGFVRTDCPGQTPCQHDAFNFFDTPSYAECPQVWENVPKECTARVSAYWDMVHLLLDGFAGHLPYQGRTTLVGTGVHIAGAHADTGVFALFAQIYTTGIWPGTVEIALFRYAGDHTVFEGLEIDHIEDLVGLGIIASDDILATETIVGDGTIDQMEIDITGIPDEEIVLFAAGDGRIPPPVPATNVVGTSVLLLAMLGLGTWALRRRTARAG